MRTGFSLALVFAVIANQAVASVSETEPNSPVTGSTLSAVFNNTQVTILTPSGASDKDPSLAIPLPLNDEMVAQLSGPRDYDWFYFDVSNPQQVVTPVYFGCDKKFGIYYEGFEGTTTEEPTWQINYYYSENPGDTSGLKLQSSYVVNKEICKRGEAETKGPFRFQLSTAKTGRYYVRVWGRFVGVREKKVGTPEITQFIDQVLAYTSDYTLRVYTTRVSGEMEPNDGTVEAFPMSAGNAVTGQLSSMFDQDWFYFDNDVSVNTAKKIPYSFTCPGQTGKTFFLSAYNVNGVLQVNYEVAAAQCSGAGGFNFTIDAPTTARYYVDVASPTFSDASLFTQSDYSLVVALKGNTPDGQTVTKVRKDGELEPNEDRINAYPIPSTGIVTAQLSTASDLDYYYIDNNLASNPAGSVPIYFKCTVDAASGAGFVISAFNSAGLLQNSYAVNAAQCSTGTGGAGPYRFELLTPTTDRYYVAVAGPGTSGAGAFSDRNYELSLSANSGASSSVTGAIRQAAIEDAIAGNADRIFFNLTNCGGKKSSVKVSGNRLNLSGVDPSTQVKVQVGPWSCVSAPRALSVTASSTKKKLYQYPKPAAAPTAKPPKKPVVTGG